MEKDYGLAITFTVDRRLTRSELDRLIDAVATQIEEPAGLNGNKRASFTVSDLVIHQMEDAAK